MLSIAVQAGGDSHRMGRDKALMPFLGQPLIERVVQRVRPIAEQVFVITNTPSDYRFLNLPLHEDFIPGAGALGGLYTALKVAAHRYLGNAACDMPFISSDLLVAAREMLENDGTLDVVMPASESGYEPMHALFRRHTCLPAVTAALESGKRRMISWLDDVNVRTLSPHEVRSYDPELLLFWNLNTPEEFLNAEAIAKTRRRR